MTRAMLVLLALGAGLVQVAVVPALFLGAAPPPVPVALIAAWGSARGSDELWPAVLVAALPVGLASEERLGWFVLALLPTAALLLRPAVANLPRLLVRATATAAAGASLYVAMVYVAAGHARALPAITLDVAAAALVTALLAAAIAALLWPFRPRTRTLFE